MDERVPKVGDWVKAQHWYGYHEVSRITCNGDIVYVKSDSGTEYGYTKRMWLFRDEPKPTVKKPKVGFSAFVTKIEGKE